MQVTELLLASFLEKPGGKWVRFCFWLETFGTQNYKEVAEASLLFGRNYLFAWIS